MSPMPEWTYVACEGIMLAVIVRWVFQLEVELILTACIGAITRLLGMPVLGRFLPSDSLHSLPDIGASTLVMVLLLLAAQLIP